MSAPSRGDYDVKMSIYINMIQTVLSFICWKQKSVVNCLCTDSESDSESDSEDWF